MILKFYFVNTKAMSLNAISEFIHHNIIIYSNGNSFWDLLKVTVKFYYIFGAFKDQFYAS